MDETTTTYITFGMMYFETPHPSGLPVDPSGWWEIRGVSYEQARAIVVALVGNQFAFDYAEDDFRREYHPAGATFIIDCSAVNGA